MNLSDREVLELHELCSALADERLAPAQQRRLGEFLNSSDEARAIYFRSIALSASLAEYAGEMQTDAPAPRARRTAPKTWVLAAVAIAACAVFGFFVFLQHPGSIPAAEDSADSEMQTGALVARITGARDCVWRGTANFLPGDAVRHGEQLDLAAGIAEITFDSGAEIRVEGPAVLQVVSAWEAALQQGGLKAKVPPQAVGFRVHHKAVEVVDLGTEFSMVADAAGEAEVHVLKGAVEVSPMGEEENTPIVLRENETRRFGKGRKAGKSDFTSQHSRLAQSTTLDRWGQRVNFSHWSFDESSDGAFKDESSRLPATFDPAPSGATSAEGRWSGALHLDGRHALSAPVPGISHPASRAVAFWVRVPEEAKLSDAHAIVAWQMRSKKFGNRPLQIGWNRNPNQGPIGALRTELGKIYAVGATSLRDGNWHHIAVAFAPIGSGDGPLQVTQYVDGRLEGSTARAIKTKRLAPDAGAVDVVWLGRSPGKHNRDKGQFRGDLDELFITDRALSQPEIVTLMMQNALPRLEVTASVEPARVLPATF